MKLNPACFHSTSRVLGAARACVLHPLSSCVREEDIRMPRLGGELFGGWYCGIMDLSLVYKKVTM